MGIGFAVSRFGLFLRELSSSQLHHAAPSTGLSTWSGVALVSLGVIVNISAVVKHFQLVHQLSSGTWVPGRVSVEAVVLALVLTGVGLGMAAYLTLVH